MKIKIQASGEPLGTKVYTEQGKNISHLVSSISFEHTAGRTPTAQIDFIRPEFLAQAENKSLPIYDDRGREICFANRLFGLCRCQLCIADNKEKTFATEEK